MADVYCDLDLGTGSNDGTSWANAYQTMAALSGNPSDGDDVWLKGTESVASAQSIDLGSDVANPVRVHGCKSATTNEPPQQSDLIPGWRTGESRTVANRAYEDADAPSLTVTGAGNDLTLTGCAYFYGMNFIIADNTTLASGSTDSLVFEECHLDTGNGELGSYTIGATNADYAAKFINSEIEWSTSGGGFIGGRVTAIMLIGVVITHAGTNAIFTIRADKLICIGCDFSAQATTALVASGFSGATIEFSNCLLNAATALFSGVPSGMARYESHLSDSTTGKSSGTINSFDIVTESGNIAVETTAVRTGGASDGSTNFSIAMTPSVGNTQENYKGLESPWMAFKITGDGTSQTVSVPIANSGAGDYNDDDAYLELVYPSEGGTAQYDNQSSQMALLGTPSAITDDVSSTWGTGGNNPQTLSAAIAPEYVGRAFCRVVFAKNFSSSPETLYVDPLPVVS